MNSKRPPVPWGALRALVCLSIATGGVALAPPPAASAPILPGEARNAPIVRDIEIVGLHRIDAAGVRTHIYSQVGHPLDRLRVSQDIKRIWRMGFFSNIVVATRPYPDGGIILVFKATERPTIVAIRYDIHGDAVDKDDIEKVVNLKRFDIVDEAKIRANLTKIEQLYIDKGHFLVHTSFTLANKPNNGRVVILHIHQGKKVEVRHVDIVGNRKLSDAAITGVLFTRASGWLSFLTKSGQFKQKSFDEDLQRIQLLYLSKGFVQAKIDPPEVTLSPDKRWMSITIRVHEGPRFRVGLVDVKMESGNWLVPKAKLVRQIHLKSGQIFNYLTMRKDETRIGDVFRDMGYANATVTTGTHVHAAARVVDFTFEIQKGLPVYFRRIEIHGNYTTEDKVIRRELKIHEGELYDASKVKLSRARVEVLGFFDKGSVKIIPKPTRDPSKMDVDVRVKEKNTGSFQIGAGFSSLESFILTAQISKQNFLGRGQTLSAQATLSGLRQLFSLSFYEPYFLGTNWTFAFDLFNFEENFIDFDRLRSGGTLSWGYRLTDDLSVSLTYTLERLDANILGTQIPINISRESGLTSSLRATVAYDSRDNRLYPSKGNYTTLSAEYAGKWLGSENEYTRLIGRTRFYFPLPWSLVFKTNLTMGWVFTPNTTPVPLFERFFLGGIYTIRGFDLNSVGESLFIGDTPGASLRPFTIGGSKEIVFNAELEIPIFLQLGIRGVLFFDAGNDWGDDETFEPLNLRTAVGFGFRWQSPVGPLRFEWGFPLAPRKTDRRSTFEFTIGNSF